MSCLLRGDDAGAKGGCREPCSWASGLQFRSPPKKYKSENTRAKGSGQKTACTNGPAEPRGNIYLRGGPQSGNPPGPAETLCWSDPWRLCAGPGTSCQAETMEVLNRRDCGTMTHPRLKTQRATQVCDVAGRSLWFRHTLPMESERWLNGRGTQGWPQVKFGFDDPGSCLGDARKDAATLDVYMRRFGGSDTDPMRWGATSSADAMC